LIWLCARAKGTQVLGQKLHDGGNVGVHAHMAAHAVGVLRQLALHALQPEQHGARMVQQAFAGGGQRHAPAVAVQQRSAHGRLQVRQALAHGRRRDELAFGRAADAAQFADGYEQLQRGEIDAARETALGAFHGMALSSHLEKVLRIFP